MAYLDRSLLQVVDDTMLGTVAEICCGRGEAFELLGSKIGRGVGVDVSLSMLKAAQREHAGRPLCSVQGDATMLPLADGAFDSVFMLGGIHHVSDRQRLFAEIARILKPGGKFYFREPVSDFALWRGLRAIIYRLSPVLDHATERPLRHRETIPFLEAAGLTSTHWQTHGFLGFCLLMNSNVLFFNRFFRYIPGIRKLTRWFTQLDEWTVRLPGMKNSACRSSAWQSDWPRDAMKLAAGFVVMISFTVLANLLMKVGAVTAPTRVLFGLASWKTVAGFLAFGCAGLIYAWLLKWLPLNVAQSFAAAQFISVILASSFLLSEWIPLPRWIGIGLIALGIILVGISTGDQMQERSQLGKTEPMP